MPEALFIVPVLLLLLGLSCLLFRCKAPSPRGMYHCESWRWHKGRHTARCSRHSDYWRVLWDENGFEAE